MMETRWQEVQDLFEQAVALPPTEHEAYLSANCDDIELRLEVASLLAHDARTGDSFLEPTASSISVEVNLSPTDPLLGQMVGGCRIVQVLGVGGMGVVYEAEQRSPVRTVAVKILQRLPWSSDARRRFDFETKILARLSHPHIAQVYGVGVHDGQPFFVMEYVHGAVSITRYAENARLTIEQRLQLILQVCGAVQHGHLNGVIHRDLKPGNILVNADGYTKVIDFGVARSTDSDMATTTMVTEVGQIVGTIQYMSPEQCQADPLGVDIRSDVYSLGFVLYELLCERKPYDVSKTTIAHAARVICEETPPQPSSLHRSLRGDLELIVLKALNKDRERRYQSVADLGRDLQRFLARDSIEARAPTTWTRMMTWFRRHPIAATSMLAGLVALGIVVGSIAAVEYTKRTPWRVKNGIEERGVQLLALNGTILHSWYPVFPATDIIGKSMDAILNGRSTTLALILRRSRDGGSHRGELCAYDIGRRDYDRPIWCDSVQNDDLPKDSHHALRESEFQPQLIWDIDIYPEIDGKEILVTFAHDYSRRAIRVYSAAGDRLHQTWHDGRVHAAHFLPSSKLLIVAATHDAHPWRNRGRPGIVGVPHSGKPLVVFAFEPTKGDWNRLYLCTDGTMNCVESFWYKCLLPAEDTTEIRKMQMEQPSPHLLDGSHLAFRLNYITSDGFPSAQAGWTIDQFGNRVGDVFFKGDGYLLQEDKLPHIESFYLGPLPPIVKPQ
jgi:predicted Ser/Thr protein kinase